ncbi:NfeD family protein [Micrococcus antarcticus]|uniref:NfeD family protein n=1 Tax=Micrococcus antarcticus TaxID=86171 RepID=UPI00384C84CD
MEWIEANAGWLWLVLALVLAGVEVLTLDLLFLMLAAGAAAGGVAALAGADLWVQIVLFAVVSLLMLTAVRPAALRRLHSDDAASASYLDTLPGRRLTADAAITRESGLIGVDGDTWSARVDAGAPDAEPGTDVRILRVDGATLIVAPVPRIDWDAARD